MGYVTEKMGKAISLARVLAWVSIAAGGGVILLIWIGVPFRAQPKGIWAVVVPTTYYILPGLMLLVFAWRMEKMSLWAYLATTILSGALIIRYIVTTLSLSLPGAASVYSPGLMFEPFLRLPSIFLMVRCLNALSNVKDEYRNRQRRKRDMQRGFEPIVQASQPLKLPPRPNLIRSSTEKQTGTIGS